jgi:hypothetical protein
MLYMNRVYRDAFRVHVIGVTIQLLMFLNLKVSTLFALADFASARRLPLHQPEAMENFSSESRSDKHLELKL